MEISVAVSHEAKNRTTIWLSSIAPPYTQVTYVLPQSFFYIHFKEFFFILWDFRTLVQCVCSISIHHFPAWHPWGHVCNSHATSRCQHFIVLLPSHRFSHSFHPVFINVPWDLTWRRLVMITHPWPSTQWYLFLALWPVRSLCINY